MYHRVLLVEDSPADRKLFQAAIEGSPVQLIIASTGLEALAILESANPELIVLDINLPGLSGLEVLSILKANPKLAPIPVVIFSTSALYANTSQAELVDKPVNLEEYISTVLAIVGR